MSFQFHPTETLEEGFRRILAEEIGRIQALLRASNVKKVKAVHDARRTFKKMRAALRLVRPAIDPEPYATLNTTFRDWGRQLSASRDAYVVTQTLNMLLQRYDNYLKEEPVNKIRDYLQVQYKKRQHDNPLSRDQMLALAEAMPEVLGIIDYSPLIPDQLRILTGGLERTYNAGRKAFLEAQNDKKAPLFHEWRKQTKYLWHQHQLLNLYWPVIMEAYSDEFHRLSELLSDEHDLFILHNRLREDDMQSLYEPYRDPLECCIRDQQNALRQSAIDKGRMLFSESPDRFVKRIKQYLKNGRLAHSGEDESKTGAV